jgi:hypothetical protein
MAANQEKHGNGEDTENEWDKPCGEFRYRKNERRYRHKILNQGSANVVPPTWKLWYSLFEDINNRIVIIILVNRETPFAKFRNADQ